MAPKDRDTPRTGRILSLHVSLSLSLPYILLVLNRAQKLAEIGGGKEGGLGSSVRDAIIFARQRHSICVCIFRSTNFFANLSHSRLISLPNTLDLPASTLAGLFIQSSWTVHSL